ncbi:oleate hydratase [Arcticibacter eurypsychrophilus]|uniref:oleate hydratase n=1 Tax=Arcticibacter eurypsychrophilus TaxID=1434752 RepID=UPI00084D3133|nr:oleate hydratase [Arcticibacter eurypsychrophilus]
MNENNKNKQAYFVGGGLGSLAGALYLIEDAGFKGENIHIIEALPILGGSNDGSGTKQDGFVCRGGRMLNEETYENLWELLSRIPSLNVPHISVKDEVLAFDHANPTHANARLINKVGKILDVHSMGFDNRDRLRLLKLMRMDEKELENRTIKEWFDDHFFTTNFWYMWQTTFAFQKWSSLLELKRYMNRMIREFSRIETLAGVTRTPYNQYESIILPIKKHLEQFNIDYLLRCTVTDLDFIPGDAITVSAIRYTAAEGNSGSFVLKKGDLCMVTNGCITDNANLGNYHTPARYLPNEPVSGVLWSNISRKKPGLGNPAPFFGKPDETKWYSFTATFKDNKMLKLIEDFSNNKPGSGALMSFVDSSWLMSIVVSAQPHFAAQLEDTTILWGYGLYPDKIGDYIKKPMIDCTGEEILTELIHHLHFEAYETEIKDTVINVIPVMMPYVDALFQPRAKSDRPLVVPKGSTNLAFHSQFVEIADDMVFTEEYSVRAAKIAVYTLLGIDRKVIPVTPHNKNLAVLLKAVYTAFR